MRKFTLFLLFAVLLISSPVQASVILDYGVVSSVNGADMAGMRVKVGLVDSSGASIFRWGTWTADSNGVSGGVVKTNWSLVFEGDNTWDDDFNWVLSAATGYTISSLQINAFKGDIFFDIFDIFDNNFNPIDNPDTPGSARGWWQNIGSASPPADYDRLSYSGAGSGYSWSFTNPVKLAGSSFEGDLFGRLNIDFETAISSFSFKVDTDMAAVPEPSTLMLLAFGLLGAAGIGRKKTIRHTLP